jgi:hypothetical protein
MCTEFDRAADKLAKTAPLDPKTEDDKLVNPECLQLFELVHIGDLVQQMLDAYYNEDIVWFFFG